MSRDDFILFLFLYLARRALIENRISVKIKEKEIQKFSFAIPPGKKKSKRYRSVIRHPKDLEEACWTSHPWNHSRRACQNPSDSCKIFIPLWGFSFLERVGRGFSG
jgi:hypothetical protein